MAQKLQEWANENEPAKNLLFRDEFWKQVIFVRDIIFGELFFPSFKGNIKPVSVISTHLSKSVKLPVYFLELPGGLTLTMRCNIYNWKISVESPIWINADFEGLFDPRDEKSIMACYCEGFPKDSVFGCFAKNKKNFTVELGSEYQVYTFLWLLLKALERSKK